MIGETVEAHEADELDDDLDDRTILVIGGTKYQCFRRGEGAVLGGYFTRIVCYKRKVPVSGDLLVDVLLHRT